MFSYLNNGFQGPTNWDVRNEQISRTILHITTDRLFLESCLLCCIEHFLNQLWSWFVACDIIYGSK